MAETAARFPLVLIKPSHYDDEGYVIQWARSWIPSNSLACVYALAQDAARQRILGDDVEITIDAYDE
ncbi:MAG: radical SAM protein, partial [Alphaproteobacteria bacterium]|nr:radical SAM protein [Alphaproteobacteria bacterium]